MTGHAFGNPAYGITRVLPGADLDAVIERTRAALAEQGFGVLSEIDIRATLKKKLNEDVAPYVILGACNPRLAHQALGGEPAIGLLLPCNVVVAQGEDGIVVSAIEPNAMFQLIDNPGVAPIASEVATLLQTAIDAV